MLNVPNIHRDRFHRSCRHVVVHKSVEWITSKHRIHRMNFPKYNRIEPNFQHISQKCLTKWPSKYLQNAIISYIFYSLLLNKFNTYFR